MPTRLLCRGAAGFRVRSRVAVPSFEATVNLLRIAASMTGRFEQEGFVGMLRCWGGLKNRIRSGSLMLLLASFVFGSHAHGEPPDKVQSTLAAIDAVLAAAKAKRVEPNKSRAGAMGQSLCGDLEREPGAVNRDFLCNQTTLIGNWTLKDLRADGGGLVGAQLEVRRFSSAEQARASKVIALERYGGKGVSIFEGAISWCYLDVFWTEDAVFTLWYGCWISLPHVKALQAVRSELLKASEPFEGTGIVGVAGTHSGWASLIDEKGAEATLTDEVRFRHFVKVANVAASDVLWLRERPQSSGPGQKVDKLPSTASCVPLVFTPPNLATGLHQDAQGWVVVKFNGHEGWVNRRFLVEQPADECASHQ